MLSLAPCGTLFTVYSKYVVSKNLHFANRVGLHIHYNCQGEQTPLDAFTQLRKATDNCVKFGPLSACCLPTLGSRRKKSASAGRMLSVKILLRMGFYWSVSENSPWIKIGKMKSTLREDQYIIMTTSVDSVNMVTCW